MVDNNCMVAIAVNDTDFMSSMPPKLTASTGVDALTHAIEALFSVNANPLTDKDAAWAVSVIMEYLPRAFADGSDEEARTMMAYAEYTAGSAFSNAGLGMVHAMAHALGGHYGLPHGVCNAVLLPYVLAFDMGFEEGLARFPKAAQAMGLPTGSGAIQTARSVIAQVQNLCRTVEIPARLSELKGVDERDFPELASLAMQDSCMATNPFQPTPEMVTAVYSSAM
jgi:alcohol dehydrogenase